MCQREHLYRYIELSSLRWNVETTLGIPVCSRSGLVSYSARYRMDNGTGRWIAGIRQDVRDTSHLRVVARWTTWTTRPIRSHHRGLYLMFIFICLMHTSTSRVILGPRSSEHAIRKYGPLDPVHSARFALREA